MGKRMVGAIAAIAVVLVCWLAYVHYRETHDDAGDLRRDDTIPPSSEAAETSLTPGIPNQPSNAPDEFQQPASQALSAPAADSIPPNPRDGMVYTGRGKFQVYRQGDLTWRLDTESGRSCVLFATMAEWTKPIVYSNGCNKR